MYTVISRPVKAALMEIHILNPAKKTQGPQKTSYRGSFNGSSQRTVIVLYKEFLAVLIRLNAKAENGRRSFICFFDPSS